MLIPRNVAAVTNKTQTKMLTANVALNTTLGDLTFNNLTVGRWYEITGQALFFLDQNAANDDAFFLTIFNGATVIKGTGVNLGANDTVSDSIYVTLAVKFQATASTVTFVTTDASVNSLIIGNNTKSATFAQLTELNDTEATVAFT